MTNEKMPEIYLAVEGRYSSWHILGYFTNKDEAEKWCILKKDKYDEPYVLTVNCLDGKDDVSDVHLLYSHEVVFWYEHKSWNMVDEPDRYSVYSGDVQANRIDCGGLLNWIKVTVNQDRFDRKKAEKIAQDLLYQYLEMRETTKNAQNEFNWMLATPQRAREAARKAEALKQKELAELDRLKKKYEEE